MDLKKHFVQEISSVNQWGMLRSYNTIYMLKANVKTNLSNKLIYCDIRSKLHKLN